MAYGEPDNCTCGRTTTGFSGCPEHSPLVQWSSVWTDDVIKSLPGTLTTTQGGMVWISAEELEDLHDQIDALQVKLRIAKGEEEVISWEEFEEEADE